MVHFRDGMWLPAEGMWVEYAEEVYETTPRPGNKGLSLLCPTKKIRRRGDTLNTSTVTLVSPASASLCTGILCSFLSGR